MKVAIRYFTGTGNTARACAIAAAEFESAGWSADLSEIRPHVSSPYTGIEGADLLLVAFPVLGFAPPRPILRWLSRLPKEKGGKAAVLAVGGAIYVKETYIPGWGADSPFSAARALRRRGREIVGIGEVSYPDNFTQAANPPEERRCRAIREKNDPAVRGYVGSLRGAFEAPGNPPLLARRRAVRVPFSLIGFLFRWFGRPLLSRVFIADESCTGCGLCARVCPTRAIKLRNGLPAWSLRCAACNRCINLCPTRSIVSSSLFFGAQLLASIVAFAAALSLPLPRELLPPTRAVLRLALLAAFFLAQMGPFSLLLRRLSGYEKLRAAFRSSFMKNYRRYRADGFHPED